MYPIVFNVFIILPAPVYLPNLSDTPPLFETFSTLLCEYTFTYLIISEGEKKGGQGHLKHTKKGDTDFPGIFDRESMRFEFTKTMHDFCFLKLYFDKSRICPRQKVKKACRCGSS